MAVSLSATLEAQQASGARRPNLLLTARARAFGFHRLSWRRRWKDNNADVPHAACVASDGSLIRARNVAGDIVIQRISDPTAVGAAWTTWTTGFATTATGRGIALAAHPTNGEVLLVYSRVNTLYYRLSSDDGASWGSETSILTEASAPSWLALAYRESTGNVCLFLSIGADVRRLRRTAGTWAASSTSSALTLDGVTGLAAVHGGSDFAVVITGTEDTTTHKKVWAAQMGDAGLPANVWSSLTTVTESDTDSGLTFHEPSLVYFAAVGAFATFSAREAGDVAVNRAWWTHTAAGATPTSTWLEPAPHAAEASNGLALAVNAAGDTAWATTPSHVWSAAVGETLSLDAFVVSARIGFTFDSSTAVFELDDASGTLTAELEALVANAADPVAPGALAPGHELVVAPGYTTSAGAEYGVSWRLQVDAVRTALSRDGRRLVTIEASGPWEAAGRWQAPQAWQSASGALTRAALFARIAARIGIPVTAGSVPHGPSSAWTAHTPSFAQVEGESGRVALRRLLAPIADWAAPDASGGGFAVRSSEDPRFEATMRRLAPDFWIRLHDQTGVQRVLEEMAGQHVSWEGTPDAGQDGPLVDQPTYAWNFAGSTEGVSDSNTYAWLTDEEGWSIVCFARADALPGAGVFARASLVYIGLQTGSSGDGLGMAILPTTGQLAANFPWVALDDLGAPGVEVGTWHLLVMTRDTTTTRGYVDGEATAATSSSTPQTPATNLGVGFEWDGSANTKHFDGQLSEVAIFKRALTPTEIDLLQEARDPAQWAFGSGAAHPLLTATPGASTSAVNWSRLVSADRYADAFDAEAVYRDGPRRRSLRVLDANSDAKAESLAAGSLERLFDDAEADATIPWHAGVQVGDVVRLEEGTATPSLWRVSALQLRYERGKRYDGLLKLAAL
jgi:hypothetical protein